MDQPTIYEKSFSLIDSEDTLKQLLMSCFIYSASYYPITQQWLIKIINKCCITTDQYILLSAIQQLIDDLNRQIIYGPNACHIAVADKPHRQHLDSCFIRQIYENKQNNLVDQVKKIMKNSWIAQFVQQQQIQQLLWYRRSNYLKLTNFINIKINGSILKQLQVNGQSWIKTTPLPTLFLVIKNILKIITKNTTSQINPKFYLLFGRLSYLHNKILQNPSKQLADDSLTSYRKYIAIINKCKNNDIISYISLLLQYVNILLFYYKYTQCQRVLQFCKNVTNLQIQFTGKMGRRTKYQSFDTAQLVMNIRDKSKSKLKQQENKIKSNLYDQYQEQIDKDAIDIPDAKQLVLKQMQTNNVNKTIQIQTSHFDQENILLEKPNYVQQQKQQNKEVPFQKILVTLSIIQYMWQSTPKDQILYQQISTSIQTILQHKDKLSYPILFNVLFLRSLNQFPRTKNVERALDQLQKLKTNFNEKSHKDTTFMYASAYSTYFQFIKTVAHKYMEIGMTMTAIQLYEKVGMIEECIDGLIAKSFKEKALALANKYQKQNGKTPRLLCMLGDIQQGDKCIQLYEQAWKLSDMRNARSQRSLGWHFFRKKQYIKAAESFKRATQANFYHPSTWFTLGCCYMQLKQFQKAIPAFGECVCIDETQGQAWGNIATCYIQQNRNKQAYSTLQQALKHSEKSWKMWSNMLSISLKIKKFYKYFECIEKLVSLQKSELINPEILKKIITIFQYQQDTAQRRRLIQAMKNRLDRLYKLLIQKIGQNPIVWNSIYQYNIQLQNYTIQNYKHYKKLHEQNKIDKNDLLQGYETVQTMDKFVQQTLIQLKQNIVSSKQTQLNMAMKVGWDSNKKLCEEITNILQQYVTTFEKYGNTKDQLSMNQFNLFVKGVQKKIQTCLQKPIQIKFTTK